MNAEIPPCWEFPFGTDAQGRDIYSRIVYGARISLTVGIVSQICNSLIGVTLGLTAGYWGGLVGRLVSGLTNLMLAIPSLIFALAIMAILGPRPGQPADRARAHQLVLSPAALRGRRCCRSRARATSRRHASWATATCASCSPRCCPISWGR